MSDANKCKNCETILIGKFCSECGQKDSELLKLKDFFKEISKDFTELDFRILVTLKKLFTNPGFLTREYWAGKKVKHTQPFKLFLFSSVIYFVLMPSEWSKYDSKINNKESINESNKKSINENEILSIPFFNNEFKIKNPLFVYSFKEVQKIGSKYEKEMEIILTMPMYALLFMFLHLNNKNLYFSHHLITSIHISSFVNFLKIIILIFSILIPNLITDTAQGLILSLFILSYLVLYLKNVYNNSFIFIILKTFIILFIGFISETIIIPLILTFMIVLKYLIIL